MPAPKTPDQITATFNVLTAHIINETAAYYLSDTKLVFTTKLPSYSKPRTNEIHFSLPEYQRDFELQSMLEYKKVLKRIKMPYYCDCANNHRILTTTPHVYTLLHEIAHIICHRIYPGVSPHGEEFCEVYVTIIEMVEPETISPLCEEREFIKWSK